MAFSFFDGVLIVFDISVKLGCSSLNVLQNCWFKLSNKSAIIWKDYHNFNLDQINIIQSFNYKSNLFFKL